MRFTDPHDGLHRTEKLGARKAIAGPSSPHLAVDLDWWHCQRLQHALDWKIGRLHNRWLTCLHSCPLPHLWAGISISSGCQSECNIAAPDWIWLGVWMLIAYSKRPFAWHSSKMAVDGDGPTSPECQQPQCFHSPSLSVELKSAKLELCRQRSGDSLSSMGKIRPGWCFQNCVRLL